MPDHLPAASNSENIVDTGLEATELARLAGIYSRTQASQDHRSNDQTGPVIDSVRKFWKHQISVIVPHEACRDHLALERTFLAYLRTSLAFSALGVAVAQLFRLQHSPTPSSIFGFFVLGKPLACVCQGAAIYCLSLGAYRTWRLQNAIVRGKIISGGFEVILLGLGVIIGLTMFFILTVAVDIDKEY